jgi:hypothetical protein
LGAARGSRIFAKETRLRSGDRGFVVRAAAKTNLSETHGLDVS